MLKYSSKMIVLFSLFVIVFLSINSVLAGLDVVSIKIKVENVDNYDYDLIFLKQDKSESSYKLQRYGHEFYIKDDLGDVPSDYYLQIIKGNQTITSNLLHRKGSDQEITIDGNTGKILKNTNVSDIPFGLVLSFRLLILLVLLFVVPVILELVIKVLFRIKKYTSDVILMNVLSHLLIYTYLLILHFNGLQINSFLFVIFALIGAGLQYFKYSKIIKGCSLRKITTYTAVSNILFYIILFICINQIM